MVPQKPMVPQISPIRRYYSYTDKCRWIKRKYYIQIRIMYIIEQRK